MLYKIKVDAFKLYSYPILPIITINSIKIFIFKTFS
jgi:hypothetical protein